MLKPEPLTGLMEFAVVDTACVAALSAAAELMETLRVRILIVTFLVARSLLELWKTASHSQSGADTAVQRLWHVEAVHEVI